MRDQLGRVRVPEPKRQRERMGSDGDGAADVTGLDVVLEGAAEALHRRPQLAVPERRELRTAETEQQLGSLIVGRGVPLGRERALEMEERLLRGACRERGLPRERAVSNEPVRTQQGLGLGEVVSELGRVGCGLVAVERLERLRDSGVEPRPPRSRQLVRERRLDQGVRELVPTCGTRHLLDDVGRQRLVQSLQERLLAEVVDEQLQLVEPELPTDRRSDGQCGAAGR